MSNIEDTKLTSESADEKPSEQAQKLLSTKGKEPTSKMNIEMQGAQNLYPVITGEIPECSNQPQPCDTQTTSSHENDGYNSESERIQPLQPRLSMCEKKLSKQLSKACVLDPNKKASTTTYATNSALAAMLSAVMTTAGFTSAQEREAISNTMWFLSEQNDHFYPDEEDTEELACPSNDNINLSKGCNNLYFRWLSKRFIHHIAFRFFTVLLIIIDVALVISAMALDCPDDKDEGLKNSTCIDIDSYEYHCISIVDFCISTFFIFEVGLRMYAMTPQFYFSKRYWFNMVDFAIVVLGFLSSLVEIILIYGVCDNGSLKDCKALSIGAFKVAGTVLRVVRIVKMFRVIRIYTEHHQLKRSMRQFVSQNKQRWVEGEFDLDLTYITKNVIGMSFPSKGMMAWYRNHIKDVAKFLDKTHGIGHYRVYNLCSERTYDNEKFHNQVEQWPIGDHNVPTVKQMVDFVSEVNAWLSENEENVAAIHCKGGKGRTGTMICILLIYRGLFRDANKCLEYFGKRRTDKHVSDQFQGVETASQIRYVTYYEKLLAMPCTYPDVIELRIEKINISGLSTVGKGNGTDLSITVHVGRNLAKKIFEAQIWNENSKLSKAMVESSKLVRKVSAANMKHYCDSQYSIDDDLLSIDMSHCLPVSEDVRVQFHCSSNKVPIGYEACAFYFWFHTAFLKEIPSTTDGKSYYMKLGREEIDNPHKQKTWNTYGENFAIELYFTKNT